MKPDHKTGGPAFPDPGRAQSAKQRETLTATGMTLRDYFAAQAISAHSITCAAMRETGLTRNVEALAKHAYAIADAMLAVRELS